MNDLGPEMLAEGWCRFECEGFRPDGEEFDHGEYMWMHPPSRRACLIGRMQRRHFGGPTWGSEPPSGDVYGYQVYCDNFDEFGNPLGGEGFWVESFGLAIKLGREYRKAVLGERRPVVAGEQLTFDDVLARASEVSR